ncbi:S-layer protein [Levilactobacillus brevis]|uniref:S-layer protein n=1 Tax=Levilactobacillus brevis TaxID=1580 RepID=UPI003EBA9033
MQSSLKKSLYLGLAALSFAGVAAVSTTASAKSYATAGAYSTLKADATTRNVEATGTNALYSKPGTVKGAKVVASKATMAKLASSKKSADYFRAYGVKTTNRGSVYYKVVTMDGKYRGYVYGGKSDTTFAGGIKSASTTTTATTPATKTYYLAKPGTTNTLWTAPKYTQYKASKVINSTEALASDQFVVDSAATKTREGSLYYHVTDQTNKSISGWIYAGALQTTPSNSALAKKGITVNYIDQTTGKAVKSGVIVTTDGATAGGNITAAQATTLNDLIGNATNLPKGYTLVSTTPVAATDSTGNKFGDTVNVTVAPNAAAGITVSALNGVNATTGETTNLLADANFASDATTTTTKAAANFLANYTGAKDSIASQSDLSAALTSAKLDAVFVPKMTTDTTPVQATDANGNKLFTKYALNTQSLPTSAVFGGNVTLYYTATGTYAQTNGSSSMTEVK